MIFRRKNNIITLSALLLTACLFSLIFVGGVMFFDTHPNKLHSDITPKDFGLSFENISFRTQDGIVLKGWFIPNKNPHAKTIILLHGYGADKGNILPTRIFLHQDYNLLLFDFRYFGQSEGAYTTIGLNEVMDLQAAIKYLQSRGINEMGVWGLSMGAAVALVGASKINAIKCIVAESSYARLDMMGDYYFSWDILRYPFRTALRLSTWMVLGHNMQTASPLYAATQLTIPVLLIHSKADNLIPFDQALLLQQALRHDPRAEFVFIDHYQHSQFDPELKNIIINFFKKSL